MSLKPRKQRKIKKNQETALALDAEREARKPQHDSPNTSAALPSKDLSYQHQHGDY
jgi:hypothetical protein